MTRAERAAEWVMDNEVPPGVNPFVDDPDDRGGATKWGVTEEVAEKHGIKVRDLTRDQAICIMISDYWSYDWVTSIRVATKLLDISVNSGKATAARLLQRALILLGSDTVKEDGKIGPITRGATNAMKEPKLLAGLAAVQIVRYLDIVRDDRTQQKWIGGWLVRGVKIPA